MEKIFDQPVKNDRITYNNAKKIVTSQRDDYETCLLYHVYFKGYYKMIAIDLSNQQALDADQKAKQ